jgi:tetratricopeptide (TPR) repeat protein
MKAIYLLAALVLLVAVPLPAAAQGDDGGTAEQPPPAADEEPGFPPAPETTIANTSEVEQGPVVDLARPSSALYADGYEAFADGRFDEAALYFEEVLRRKPDHPSARNYLVECFVATGRVQDAQAVRDGAVPPGDPTRVGARAEPARTTPDPVVERTEQPKKELSEEEKKNRRNPRRLGLASIGLQVGGPAIGFGLYMEFKPGWFFAVSGGVGGVGVISDQGRGGIGGAWVEVAIRPVPIRITPVVGVGLSVFGGSDVWRLDTLSSALLGQGRSRVAPYILIGVRYDARKPFFVSAGVHLFPTGQTPYIFLPYPGARVGLRF